MYEHVLAAQPTLSLAQLGTLADELVTFTKANAAPVSQVSAQSQPSRNFSNSVKHHPTVHTELKVFIDKVMSKTMFQAHNGQIEAYSQVKYALIKNPNKLNTFKALQKNKRLV